jgi:hypothetical protein
MTSSFLVFSFVAQVMLWIFAIAIIEKARRVAWDIHEKQRRIDEMHKDVMSYLNKIDAEQERMWNRVESFQKWINARRESR